MSEALVFDHYPLAKDQVPPGWAITSVGQIARLVASGFPSGKHNLEGIGVPHIRPMNIDRDGRLDLDLLKYVDGAIPRELSKGDVLFNNTNSPELIGKTTVVSTDRRLAYSNHMTRVSLEDGFDPIFIARQLHFLWLSGYFRHRCANHVNQASIAATPLSSVVPIAVAPSSEQTRIGEELDELFSDVDAGTEALEKARDKLRLYRASVLKAAVEGALTADWRTRHPQVEPASELLKRILVERRRRWEEDQLRKFEKVGKAPPKNWKAKYKQPVIPDTTGQPRLPEGWCWATVDQLAEVSGGITKGQKVGLQQPTREVPYLRVANVQRGYLDLSEVKLIRAREAEINSLQLKMGDVLFTEGGDRDKLGRGWIWSGEIEQCIHQNHIFRARPISPQMQSKLISWAGNSYGQSWFLRAGKQSVNLASINMAVLKSFPVPVAPVDEQMAIVEAVDDHLSVVDYIESSLDTKRETAQSLRQAILRHAFTGKLVPQDPNDEPATELLERIVAERDARAREARTAQRTKRVSRRRRR